MHCYALERWWGVTDYRVLDLFCGLGGFSQAFAESDRWVVTTVDIEERFEPDIQADVFDLRPSDFDQEFDVVLASPPCTQFSFAASRYERIVDGQPQTDDSADAVALVYHTIGLITGLSPTYWVLENPQGWLRHIIDDPTGRVTYCQYGESWMKPTDLWGEHPPGLSYLTCSYGDECHNNNTDQAHGGLGNCLASGTRDPAERAKVPEELSEAIRDACEAALDGNVAEQATLTEVADA
jgi:hypothetical protein